MSIAGSTFEHIKLKRDHLVICGGGHVSIPVIRMGKMLGFWVTVLEDRPLFANHARSAEADEVICDAFVASLSRIKSDQNTYFVVVTRGHRYDLECLRSILKKEYAYVGMMGSRVRSGEVKKTLCTEGFSEDVIATLHSPIGLSIGGETPEEIAVSIMAQLIQVRHERKKEENTGYTPEILEALLSPEDRKRCLAVIISRKGSAPRSVGTKMVIFEDGSLVGTIGGGCVEAEVTSRALGMLRNGEREQVIMNINMLPEQAEEEEMVCGGILEISLDVIDLN